MTYSITKPDSGPSPALDVTQIQTNFSQFGTIFSANHTAMNDVNQGDHEAVIIKNQATDPGVTQNLAILYCKNATSQAGTQPQLFAQIPKFLPNQNDSNNAANTPVQLTYNQVNTAGPVFQSFLPGGYLLYFGSVASIASPITLTPSPTQILVAIATPYDVNVFFNSVPFTVSTTILTNSTFRINCIEGGTTVPFGWIAIARA